MYWAALMQIDFVSGQIYFYVLCEYCFFVCLIFEDYNEVDHKNISMSPRGGNINQCLVLVFISLMRFLQSVLPVNRKSTESINVN